MRLVFNSLLVAEHARCQRATSARLWVGAFDTTQSGAASLLYLQWLNMDPYAEAPMGGNAYVYGEQNSGSPIYRSNGYQTVNAGRLQQLLQNSI